MIAVTTTRKIVIITLVIAAATTTTFVSIKPSRQIHGHKLHPRSPKSNSRKSVTWSAVPHAPLLVS